MYNEIVKKTKIMLQKNDELVQAQETALSQEELIFKNLIEQNPSLYKAPSGEIYQIYLEESGTESSSYETIHSNYGKNCKYDADVDYQRLKDQHKPESKKKILHDILMGERVGRIVVYRKPGTVDNFEVVDGKQRIEMLRSFISGELKLTGKYAASFWARFYLYLVNPSPKDSVLCNNLKKSLANNKSVPDVKFQELPSRLQDRIKGTKFDIATITEVKFRNIKTDLPIQLGHPDYNEELAKNQITRKFGKLNSQVAQAKPEDTVYGQTNDVVTFSRKFVRTSHPLLSNLGIETGKEIDNKQQREFAFNLITCLVMFEKNKNGNYFIDWAPRTKTIQDLIIDNKVDELSDLNLRFLDFLGQTIRKLLSQKYHIDNEEKYIKFPNELVGKQKKVVHLVLLCSLRIFFEKVMNDRNLFKKYFNEGGPNNSFGRFFQMFLEYLSLLSLASKKDREQFVSTPESPVMRYNLGNDYFDLQNFQILDEVILLNKNNGVLGQKFRDKISKLIDLVNSKI